MRTLILVASLALCAGCATPSIGPPSRSGPPSGEATGGDAEATAQGLDFTAAFAQPGGTAVAAPVRNEDRTSSANAGDAPQLILGLSSEAASILENDPVRDALLRALAVAETAGDQARIDDLIARLEDHETVRMSAVSAVGGYPSLRQVVFLVWNWKLAGVDPQKIPADAIEAASKSLEAAMKPAVGATQ